MAIYIFLPGFCWLQVFSDGETCMVLPELGDRVGRGWVEVLMIKSGLLPSRIKDSRQCRVIGHFVLLREIPGGGRAC